MASSSFGAFDVSGNLAEWTDSICQQPLRPLFQSIVEESREDTSERNMFYDLAGGRYKQSAQSAVTNASTDNALEYSSIARGFRLARTIEVLE